MRINPDRESPIPSARTRRHFIADAALLAAGLSIGCSRSADRLLAPSATSFDVEDDAEQLENGMLPTGDRSGIEHVVLVMMENRSFDHLLGWLPHANGRQAGLRFADAAGVLHETHPLAPDFQGCGFNDPDHSYAGGRVEYDDGKCDGWLRAGRNDIYSIGYYERKDLPFLGRAAVDYTACDRYHCGILGPTFPNRFYQHAAQTDRLSNTLTLATLPTIWDRLAARGISAQYYFSDLPFLALWGSKYTSITRPVADFFAAAQAGALPAVSFIDPVFGGEDQGTSSDDHPHGDIRVGESFLNNIYKAVSQGPAWDRTVLVINFDEWGGFFDHVPPPLAPIPDADRAVGSDGRIGFRTPALIISPLSRRGHVSHHQFDHTSVLRMIEWRWDLDPLTVRDQTANNLALALDLKHPERHAPQYLVPTVVASACPAQATIASASRVGSGSLTATLALPQARAAWSGLRSLALSHGFPVTVSP
jgi:phospholipase C